MDRLLYLPLHGAHRRRLAQRQIVSGTAFENAAPTPLRARLTAAGPAGRLTRAFADPLERGKFRN